MTVVDGEVDAGTATISGAILVRSPGFEDSTGIPGIPDHGVLTGRDEPDQHPASAIDVDGTPLDTVLDNVPLLDAANMFTAKQSIDVQVPVTHIADIATTKPTILAHLHGGAGAIVDHFAATIEIPGYGILKTAGMLMALTGLDGVPTDEWVMASATSNFAVLRVTSTDPGELPWISDLFAAVPDVVTVGTPTAAAHAATKAYVDAGGDGALRTRQLAQAERTTPPARWAVGGTDPDHATQWAAPWQAPDATSTLVIEDWIRVIAAREPGYYETIAESLDGIGDVDRYERAAKVGSIDGSLDDLARLDHFSEGTAPGAVAEWQRPPNAQQDFGALSPLVAGVWVRGLTEFDFDAHTITHYVEDDVIWDYEANGRKWATTGVYTNPGITGLRSTEGEPTWIGRGVGEFHIAEVRMWVDGTEVLHFDPSGADIGDSTLADSVAATTWTGTTGAVIGGTASGGGAVDSVNGETGVVVLDATDVGADPAGSAAAAQAAAIAASQPVDSDLTAIAALTTTSYGRAFLALADAAAGRTALGLGTAATTAATDYATAAHTHTGTYQPLDSDLTALAALTTTAFGRALLELADAAAARTAIGAMASTATLPWHDDFTVVHAVRDPLPVTGTYTQSPGALRGGGYTLSQSGPGWVFTYARIPLRAGTYTRRYVARTDSNSGIVTFTIGGISAGTADGYSVGNVNDVVFDATGIVIPSDGFYDLVLTSTTKNASSAGWRANAQLTRLFRTGA